jgi:amino acid transporter
VSLSSGIRRILLGERLPTAHAIHERLPKFLALPIFSSDAISSAAYATEEILLALVVAATLGLAHSMSIALVIAALFTIVVISYRQTIHAYPSGGGSYIVARENLGLNAGLIAAAALLIDYVLTVAVSISSGVDAILSAVKWLEPFRVHICLLLILFIALANLRGARESGWLFAFPTYLFISITTLLIIMGIIKLVTAGGHMAGVHTAPIITPKGGFQAVTIILLVRAFASGCAALTGIEAISNGIQAFRPPESRNAATTLVLMASICIVLLLGVTLLAQMLHLVPYLPKAKGFETIFSQLGRNIFGSGPLYIILQVATAAVLVLAANTSFAGFPRLTSILARDRLAPRQLFNLGDRLVYSNGIVVLAFFSMILVVGFGGLTHHLIPLYAVGVFAAFTLSQAGMVKHWRKLRTPGWHAKATVNAVGAVVTGIVLIVVLASKFRAGAFIVTIAIPLLIYIFMKIHSHYEHLRAALTVIGYQPPRAMRTAVIVLMPSLHRGVIQALLYAKSISSDPEAVYVEVDPTETPRIQEQWAALHIGMPLTVLKSPWRSILEPILQYIRTIRTERGLDTVTVVLPEFETTRWWHRLLHNQTGLTLKIALMFESGVVVTNVRYRVDTPPQRSWLKEKMGKLVNAILGLLRLRQRN